MNFFYTLIISAVSLLLIASCAEDQAAQGLPPDTDKEMAIGDSLFAGPEEQRLKKELTLARDLARTIEQLSGVERARVHLSLAGESILDRGAPKESQAAIVVIHRSGSQISEQAIRELATAAVARLTPNRVRVFLNEASRPPAKTVFVGPIEVAASSALEARICLGCLLLLSLGLAIGLIVAGVKIRRLRPR